jgi:uncharacterized protein with FMN-binding domain
MILVSLICGWVVGLFRHHSDIAGFLKQALPGAVRFDSSEENIYTGLTQAQGKSKKAGFVAIRSAHGYAGPVTIAVGLDTNGKIANAVIVRHTESPAFFRRVTDNGFPGRFKGKDCLDQFEIGGDVDSVTGATVSLAALAEAVRVACSDIAIERLGLLPTVKNEPAIQFGLPEILLILLIVTGFAAYGKKLPANTYMKWVVLAASLVFIGFVLKRPISLININSLLIGYWPRWQDNVYWYLLLAAVLLPVILRGKTPYCSNICPFGATQEILIELGGARRQLPEKYSQFFKVLQRSLAWIAVMCALVFRNPAIITYEVSATFFTIIGQNWQFVLLTLVLILSLFITRPWCNCLCPVRAVSDYIRLLRRAFT